MLFQSAPRRPGRSTHRRPSDHALQPVERVSIRSPAPGEIHEVSLDLVTPIGSFQSAPRRPGRSTPSALSGTLRRRRFNPLPGARGDPPASGRRRGHRRDRAVSIRSPAPGEIHHRLREHLPPRLAVSIRSPAPGEIHVRVPGESGLRLPVSIRSPAPGEIHQPLRNALPTQGLARTIASGPSQAQTAKRRRRVALGLGQHNLCIYEHFERYLASRPHWSAREITAATARGSPPTASPRCSRGRRSPRTAVPARYRPRSS